MTADPTPKMPTHGSFTVLGDRKKEKVTMTVQAKMRCTWNESTQWATEKNPAHVVRFTPVYSDDPEDPNHKWSKYTPAGTIELMVTNPAAFDRFEINAEYLVTFERQ